MLIRGTTVSNALAVVLLASLLAGCSVRYTPRVPGFQPGYVDERLGENTYQVRIGEAWPKDWPNLEKFALYRAAEITLSHGRNYFVVTGSTTQITQHQIPTPATTHTTGTATAIGNTFYGTATSVTTGGGASVIQGGWYYLDFIIIDDSKPRPEGVFDARTVVSELRYFIDSRR